MPKRMNWRKKVGKEERASVKIEWPDRFTQSYIQSALFFSNDEDGVSLDRNYDVRHIAPETIEEMFADASKFQESNWDDISIDPARAAHDFWLTRNRDGVGFWSHSDFWGDASDGLTESAHDYGEYSLYVGDDGLIHGSGG